MCCRRKALGDCIRHVIINSYLREFSYNVRLLHQRVQEVLLLDTAVNITVKVLAFSKYNPLTSRLGGEPMFLKKESKPSEVTVLHLCRDKLLER